MSRSLQATPSTRSQRLRWQLEGGELPSDLQKGQAPTVSPNADVDEMPEQKVQDAAARKTLVCDRSSCEGARSKDVLPAFARAGSAHTRRMPSTNRRDPAASKPV